MALRRSVLLPFALLVACGGGAEHDDAGVDAGMDTGALDAGGMDAGADGGAPDTGAGADAGEDADLDGGAIVPLDTGAACFAWQLVELPTTVVSLEDPTPLNPGRTARAAVGFFMGGCDELGMPVVQVSGDGTRVEIGMRTWRRGGVLCGEPAAPVTRLVPFRPLATTTQVYTIFGGHSVEVTVGADPGDCDPTRAQCEVDCDCDQAAGEVCLGGSGAAGPFRQCARPCELDRDCGGRGRCVDVPGGLSRVCDGTVPECDDAHPCPAGFSCGAGACEPDFRLGSGTRVDCTCDTDCAPGLRCARAERFTDPFRCEALCYTGSPGGGAWCQGAHACGEAEDDLSGLARTGAVCGFLGE